MGCIGTDLLVYGPADPSRRRFRMVCRAGHGCGTREPDGSTCVIVRHPGLHHVTRTPTRTRLPVMAAGLQCPGTDIGS